MPITVTTALPDAGQPMLDTTVEDELGVDVTDVTNYGDVRVQIRETGQSSWDSGAIGYHEAVLASDSDLSGEITTTFTGLEDGEEFEVRVRTETEHVIGAWTTPVAGTLPFPAPTNLTVDDRFDTVQLSYQDNSDHADEVIKLQRSPADADDWTTINTYGPNTTSVEDATRAYYQEFDYRIRQETEHTYALSNVETVIPEPTDRPPYVAADGWTVVLTHPETGRKLHPDILDQPELLPSLNSLPEIRVPIRKSDTWLEDHLDENPEMDVWEDGEKQPIDRLDDVEHRQDRTILVGIGGEELRDRVQAEYDSERPTVAVEDLVQNETSYDADVDEPEAGDLENSVLQNPDSDGELAELLTVTDTDPLAIQNGHVETLQTSWFNTQTWSIVQGDVGNSTNDAFESGYAQTLGPIQQEDIDGDGTDESAVAIIEFSFTPEYTIPTWEDSGSTFDELGVAVRTTTDETTVEPELQVVVDGAPGPSVTIGHDGFDETEWDDLGLIDQFGEIPAGQSIDVRIQRIDNHESDQIYVDCVALYDRGNRFGGFSYSFPNTLDSPGGHFDGPGAFPDALTVEPADAATPFTVLSGEASVTVEETASRLQLSNDRGQTWLPDDGSEQDTNTVSVDFQNPNSYLRLRADIGRYSPNGAQDETPRYGYAGQSIDAWELLADLRLETLLVDRIFDDSLESILTEIAGEDFLWSFNLDDDGNPQISWTQPGQREADSVPSLSGDPQISKSLSTYPSVTIKGSNKPVSSETFTADTDDVALGNADIVPGSESIYDDQGNYDRGADYEMDYRNGEIRAVSSGGLSQGQDYSIDYSYEVSGSYTVQDAPQDPRELVEQVPAVTSENTAEQIAFTLATRYSTPRYSANITIPTSEVGFDPLEALTLEALGLPADAGPLEVREQPQITPSGIDVRLGSRAPIEAALSELSSQVSAVSKRV